MKINVAEMFENGDLNYVCEELEKLIVGKKIKLYEYNDQNTSYDFINDYNVISVEIFECEQLTFTFGPGEWDMCSINNTDLIVIE
jgi:hypothetical protein